MLNKIIATKQKVKFQKSIDMASAWSTKKLVPGKEYTIKQIIEEDFVTFYILEEFPMQEINSCCFEELPRPKKNKVQLTGDIELAKQYYQQGVISFSHLRMILGEFKSRSAYEDFSEHAHSLPTEEHNQGEEEEWAMDEEEISRLLATFDTEIEDERRVERKMNEIKNRSEQRDRLQ